MGRESEKKAIAMDSTRTKLRDSTRVAIDPPAFSPPREMRVGYLARRKDELELMLDQARAGEWKPVMTIINHVRGTGVMYGFDNMGLAAEEVMKAVQSGEAKSFALLEGYAKAVNESYV